MVRRLRASAWGSNCNNLGGKVNSCKGCWIGSSLVAFMGFIVLNPFLCFVLMGAKFAGKKSDVNLKLIIFKTFLWFSRFHRKWRKLAFKICQKKKERIFIYLFYVFSDQPLKQPKRFGVDTANVPKTISLDLGDVDLNNIVILFQSLSRAALAHFSSNQAATQSQKPNRTTQARNCPCLPFPRF